MIDREKVISGLEFTKAMITFNPSTGEDIEPENLNEENKTTYDACVGAIALLKEQEPMNVLDIADSIEGIEVGKCPRCRRTIVSKQSDPTRFCKFCGKEVNWE